MADKESPAVRRPKKEKRDERKPHFKAGANTEENNAPARPKIRQPDTPHHRYVKGYKKSTRHHHKKK